MALTEEVRSARRAAAEAEGRVGVVDAEKEGLAGEVEGLKGKLIEKSWR